jgi:hypothetical protein
VLSFGTAAGANAKYRAEASGARRLAVAWGRLLRRFVAESLDPNALIVTIDRTGPLYIVAPTARIEPGPKVAGTPSWSTGFSLRSMRTAP